ncbi:MAG: hypothetical protein R3301_17570, partial [Saprospiraceae bacterium]|nr:hypothetical protein [Saprospiraceae bacterium]
MRVAIKHLVIFLFVTVWVFESCQESTPHDLRQLDDIKVSGALKAMHQWHWERAYPSGKIPTHKISTAYSELQDARQQFRAGADEWAYIGPYNVAGRTLALAFHP